MLEQFGEVVLVFQSALAAFVEDGVEQLGHAVAVLRVQRTLVDDRQHEQRATTSDNPHGPPSAPAVITTGSWRDHDSTR
jgi:hypothetical protein